MFELGVVFPIVVLAVVAVIVGLIIVGLRGLRRRDTDVPNSTWDESVIHKARRQDRP